MDIQKDVLSAYEGGAAIEVMIEFTSAHDFAQNAVKVWCVAVLGSALSLRHSGCARGLSRTAHLRCAGGMQLSFAAREKHGTYHNDSNAVTVLRTRRR